MGITDYYFLLGVPRFAPLDQVKAAYRKLAAQYHPDKVVGLGPEAEAKATARMTELNEAMAVLSDPARREQYHQLLELIPERPLTPPPKPKPKPPPRPGAAPAEGLPEPSRRQPPPEEPEDRPGLSPEEQLGGLREALLRLPLKWKEKKQRGWQWAFEHSDLRRHIVVACRHFENLSRLSIGSVINGVNELADERKLAWSPTAVIALISYERVMDVREVQSQLRALDARRGWFKKVRPVVVLHDAKTQAATLFGSPGEDTEARRVVHLLARGREPR